MFPTRTYLLKQLAKTQDPLFQYQACLTAERVLYAASLSFAVAMVILLNKSRHYQGAISGVVFVSSAAIARLLLHPKTETLCTSAEKLMKAREDTKVIKEHREKIDNILKSKDLPSDDIVKSYLVSLSCTASENLDNQKVMVVMRFLHAETSERLSPNEPEKLYCKLVAAGIDYHLLHPQSLDWYSDWREEIPLLPPEIKKDYLSKNLDELREELTQGRYQSLNEIKLKPPPLKRTLTPEQSRKRLRKFILLHYHNEQFRKPDLNDHQKLYHRACCLLYFRYYITLKTENLKITWGDSPKLIVNNETFSSEEILECDFNNLRLKVFPRKQKNKTSDSGTE